MYLQKLIFVAVVLEFDFVFTWFLGLFLLMQRKSEFKIPSNVIHSTTNQTRAAVVVVVGYDVFRE
jgi:hypothetical protein